ncbi:N-acetylneuraminate synthase [Candidatus Formimonas warabiya]|uniref:N-acetylneuraminate synthase n=1 Tax=Formimonas warabiya TaxID=1761012 RepID=A0A3G1KT93_FORW1|nr:N-acetylneuraminate synthase [Candidatus Formimonas warabiya]ATW25681.1 N-acetylneuraminate synthase [Candidatus Formimonas warabiya]
MNISKVIVIAEAGVNHNGSMELAKEMIIKAKEAGADIVKFQTAVPELVMTRSAGKAEYQVKLTGDQESQLEMCKRIHLPIDSYKELKSYAKKAGIEFLSSPFDLVSIDVLEEIGLATFKIPSGEITNLTYLEKIGRLGKRVIMSVGMATLGEIEAAVTVLERCGTKRENIIVLHCNTQYPTPYEDVNLNAMLTIRDALKVRVGYSDHTPGIEIPIAAVTMGACVIEKHFTLDRNMEGPDHKASLEPQELSAMVQAIRHVESALGDGIKRPSQSEQPNISIARKSIVAARAIRKGELFTTENLIVKRPGNGISPMRWYEVLGQIALKDFEEDELIKI